MPLSLQVFLAQSLLIFGLATPAIAPYTGVYFALAALVLGLLPLRLRAPFNSGDRAYQLLGLAVLLLLVPIPFHWSGPADFYPVVVILPILLAPGAAALVRRFPRLLSLEIVSWALLGGAIGAAVLVLYQSLALGIYRPGGDNNPIHFGGIAAILGFGAATGFLVVTTPWRLVFLAGPILAAVAVFLSGSRGPAIALIGLSLMAVAVMLWQLRRSRLIWLVVVALILAGGIIWYFMRGLPEFDRIVDAVIHAPTTLFDLSSGLYGERVALITGAIGAYFDAPVLGHGFSHMMHAIVPHVPAEFATVANFDHLHSDLADFGVSGGVFGLLALASLLLSPFGAALAHRRRTTHVGALYLAGVMALGYLLLGLTNAVIGVLPQTTLFGVLLGILIGTAGHEPEGNQANV